MGNQGYFEQFNPQFHGKLRKFCFSKIPYFSDFEDIFQVTPITISQEVFDPCPCDINKISLIFFL